MKKILLVLYFCFNLTLSVFATDWKQIDDKLYIDIDSIESYSERYETGNTRKFSFWIKSLNDSSSYFTKIEKAYNKKIWYLLSKNIVDCNEKMIANKSFVIYDLKSQVIDSNEEYIYPGSWNSIVPDSIGELYYSNICTFEPVSKISVPKLSNLNNENGKPINWGPYMHNLEKRIKRNWNPPKDNASKRSVVIFRIGRDGRLLSIKIVKSSGSVSTDDAAKAAIEMTAPFAPLPVEFEGNSIDVEFTFDYNVFGSFGRNKIL